VGATYALAILWDGQRFEGRSIAHAVAPIDSLYFDPPKPGRFSGTGGVRATIDLADPAGRRDFYLWDQFVDGVRALGPDSTFRYRVIAPDDAVDGLRIRGFQPYEGIDIPVGSTVVMRQIGLSEEIYRYYFALSDQVSADGSPFAVPPASVRGNVANVTDPSRFPLGYFYAAEVSEARATRRQ
jgi:extradiol dioxygenase family protein